MVNRIVGDALHLFRHVVYFICDTFRADSLLQRCQIISPVNVFFDQFLPSGTESRLEVKRFIDPSIKKEENYFNEPNE